MKRAVFRFCRIFSLLLVATILFSSLAVLARPTVAAGIPARTDAQEFSNCAGAIITSCDLQVFLLIDDSSSMLYSDASQLRYEGVKNVLDILAKEYYLPAVDANDPNIQPPKISVSFIHFNAAVISDLPTQWKEINPDTIKAWPDQLKTLDKDIHIKLDYQQKQNTDFSKALEVAAKRAAEKPQDPKCPRLVMLFTDGVPNLTGADLKGDKLKQYMGDLLKQYQNTFNRANDLFYVTEFGSDPVFQKTWNKEYKPEWDKFTEDPGPADLPFIKFVDHNILAARMEGIIGKAIGSPAFALAPTSTGSPRTYEAVVSDLVESLRLTLYYDVNTKTTLTVTDKDGNEIKPDGAKVTFSGANTPIQVFEIKNPTRGTYTITTTAPGGTLTQMLTFQKIVPKIVSSAGYLQQFTKQKVSIQLLGADDRPLAVSQQMAIQTRVTTSDGPEGVDFKPAGDAFTAEWMPLVSDPARIDACITMTNNKKMYVLYNGPVGEIPIDKVAMQVGPSEPVCALEDKDILVPLTLVNSRSGQPTKIDASLEWRNIVSTQPISIARLAIDPVDNPPGNYLFHFRPASLGAVGFQAKAAIPIENEKAGVRWLDPVTIQSTGLQAPRQVKLDLQNYSTLGDRLSVLFYKWSHPFCPDRNPVVLIGRRWFGLFGPTLVQIGGRYFDTSSLAAETGIERFSVQLVSLGGGRSSDTANHWTSLNTGDGASAVQIPAPGLGFYQVVVSDQGGSLGCAQLAPLPAAQTVLLIGDFWEYLIILAIIVLLALGAFLLRSRFRSRPNLLLYALPIVLLIVDAILVMALVNNAFKCQFNCSYLVDHSLFGYYPAENQASLCRGVSIPLDEVPLFHPTPLGKLEFLGLTIPRVSIFDWSVGPITLIPAFTIGPVTIPGWNIPARLLPVFPALRVIDPPLEVLRRFVSWGFIVLFVISSLVLGNIAARINNFIGSLKDPQKRLEIITNVLIWLLCFVSFCALFYFSVVQKVESRSVVSTIAMIIPFVIGVLIIVLLILLAKRMSQKGQQPPPRPTGNSGQGPHPTPAPAPDPAPDSSASRPGGNGDHGPRPAPVIPPEPVVPRPAENTVDNRPQPAPVPVPEPAAPRPAENNDDNRVHPVPVIAPEPAAPRPAEDAVDNHPHPVPVIVPEPAAPRPAEDYVDNRPHPVPAVVPEPAGPGPTPAFRRTKGIVDDQTDAAQDADVIMTAAALGLATACIVCNRAPIQFDIDPEDRDSVKPKDREKFNEFVSTVDKMTNAVFKYLDAKHIDHNIIEMGCSPDYAKGGVIMGVYKMAGQGAPLEFHPPYLSKSGRELYDRIKNYEDKSVHQYTGRGAYTGFVDNSYGLPIGPLSTVRFKAPAPGTVVPIPHPRWLPPFEGNLAFWKDRKRKGLSEDGPESYVPWGLIGGDKAQSDPATAPRQPSDPANAADELTKEMKDLGMVFHDVEMGDEVTIHDIGCYTHGMIQAIYKAYHLGPGCVPYEIAVGEKTRKLASYLPCTLFMVALGYPPTSIHLGRGESWAPLYKPYLLKNSQWDRENKVIRDLNNQWYENCLKWLIIGLDILVSGDIIDDAHKNSLAKVDAYLHRHAANAFQKGDAASQYRKDHDLQKFIGEVSANIDAPDYTVGGVLILDAVTIHEAEQTRINRTLKG